MNHRLAASTAAAVALAAATAWLTDRRTEAFRPSDSQLAFRPSAGGCFLTDGKTRGYNRLLLADCGDVSFSAKAGERASDRSLQRLQFRQTRLTDMHFRAVDLSESNGRGALVRNSRFERTNFARADLRGLASALSIWNGVDFRGADMRGSSFFRDGFVDCDFRGSDLREAALLAASFARSRFDDSTRLPFSKDEAIRRGMTYDAGSRPPRSSAN